MTGSMPHRLGLRTVLFGVVVGASLLGCSKDQLEGPKAEVRKSDAKINLPALPDFQLPESSGDGRSIKEMRVKGRKFLETEITVKGYVTWAYDCPTAIRQPGMSEADVQKMIDDDPAVCERAKFYIGDSRDTPAEKSMWVVDVPRPFNKRELKVWDKKQREEELAVPNSTKCDIKKNGCPPYKVGDEVIVTGMWRLASPHSERNSDGLLVYKSMKNVTQNWESPPKDPSAAPATPDGAKPSPEDLVKGKG